VTNVLQIKIVGKQVSNDANKVGNPYKQAKIHKPRLIACALLSGSGGNRLKSSV
jgi:hypothetical protein